MRKIVTLQDAAQDRHEADMRMFARWDRDDARRRAKVGMTCDEAGILAARTDPRIGVLCRKGKSVFYAVIDGWVVESRDIAVVADALKGGAL